VGIDLTGASVVIHYDRWWNPARENQATDRVHRLGQRRFVQVFKLVTRNTVEERIDALIREKARLIEEVVSPSEDPLRGLGRRELAQLLGVDLEGGASNG
jgi:SNF2 family DNA or RNA helicase